MQIYAKIGTGSGSIIWVGYKRKLPIVGDFIKFKPHPPEKYAKWETGVIDEIKDVGNQLLYFIERM